MANTCIGDPSKMKQKPIQVWQKREKPIQVCQKTEKPIQVCQKTEKPIQVWQKREKPIQVYQNGEKPIQSVGDNRSGKHSRRESAMAENDKSETIETLSPSCEKERTVIQNTCSSTASLLEEEDESPIRQILCVKNNADVKRFEETDDCFILDFDPYEPPDISKVSLSTATDDDDFDPDLTIVAERGQVVVACRDYPHPRHLCQKKKMANTCIGDPSKMKQKPIQVYQNPFQVWRKRENPILVWQNREKPSQVDQNGEKPIQSVGDNRSGKHSRRESAMAENDKSETIETLSPSCEKERMVIQNTCSSTASLLEEEDESPIRQILCVKNNADVKRFEETDDCFILDFDPYESPDISKVSLSTATDDDDFDPDLTIVAEKGQVVVACRDYPHPRHLCQKFPFETTPHESYCELCYCYVCDSAAPCQFWKEQLHCHAFKNNGHWDSLRVLKKQQAVIR